MLRTQIIDRQRPGEVISFSIINLELHESCSCSGVSIPSATICGLRALATITRSATEPAPVQRTALIP